MLTESSLGGRDASASRKVRTPQGTVLGNAQAGRPDRRLYERMLGHWTRSNAILDQRYKSAEPAQ